MNRITLIRLSESKEDTLGTLFWDGRFKCFTLEDEFRAVKVMGETRIPEGEYKLELRKAGRLHKIFSDRWSWHQHGMIWLRAVPNFKWIYLHPGVNSGHSEGCILVGDQATTNFLNPGGDNIGQSSNAYARIYPPITEMILQDETFIRIQDNLRLW